MSAARLSQSGGRDVDRLMDIMTGLSLLLIVLVLASVRRAHIRVEYSVSWLIGAAALLVLSRAPVSQPGPRRWSYVLGAFLALAAVFEAYQPGLSGPFVFDDNFLPFRMPSFPVHALRPWLVGVRPLLMFSYWVNFELSGGETFSYHAFNVLFHAMNAVLIFLILRNVLDWAAVVKERLDILAGVAG